MNKYHFLSIDDIEYELGERLSPFELNKIRGAYEIAEAAHQNHRMVDKSPYFYHLTRVVGILIRELHISDPDLIITTLLHDSHKTGEEITIEIVDFNFGPYVSLLIENFREDRETLEMNPEELDFDIKDKIRNPGDDYLIIRMAETVDRFRSMDFNPMYNPINLILETSKKYFALIESCATKELLYLLNEIKKERNKIIG